MTEKISKRTGYWTLQVTCSGNDKSYTNHSKNAIIHIGAWSSRLRVCLS